MSSKCLPSSCTQCSKRLLCVCGYFLLLISWQTVSFKALRIVIVNSPFEVAPPKKILWRSIQVTLVTTGFLQSFKNHRSFCRMWCDSIPLKPRVWWERWMWAHRLGNKYSVIILRNIRLWPRVFKKIHMNHDSNGAAFLPQRLWLFEIIIFKNINLPLDTL